MAAYARDRDGDQAGADPLPERRAARLLAAFIASGLFFLALPGTFMGVGNLLLIAAQQAPGAPKPAWIQAHGQAQILGWVGSFILGISLYILPKFRGIALRPLALGWCIWGLWTGGVAIRWLAGIAVLPAHPSLIAAAALELGAFALSQYLLVVVPARAARRTRRDGHGAQRRTGALDAGSALGIAGFCGLGIALLVNLGAALATAPEAAAYPPGWDARWVELAVWAFIVPIAVGYSTRFVTVFLALRPARFSQSVGLGPYRIRLGSLLAAVVAALMVAALAGFFAAADILALAFAVVAVWALRIFAPAARPPKLAGVYRGYPAFIRLAYGWLLVGAGLGLAAHSLPALTGLPGAARHAITVGFIATLIFALGPRILPNFLNSRQLHSRGLMAASLWLLTCGCGLRVVSEAMAYGSPAGWAWRVLPISAFTELGAVLLFVANLALTLAQSPRAWFQLDSIHGDLPLYWCIASYPRTRGLLVKAGLATLERARRIPRSLTLAEAARADRVNTDDLCRLLRDYFQARQPRRRRTTAG